MGSYLKVSVSAVNQLPTKVNCYLYSFYPHTVKVWNHLPKHLSMINLVEFLLAS